jgi:PGM1 C-terminal domain/ATP-grasp domain
VKLPPYDPAPGSPAEVARFHELQARLRGRFEVFRGDRTLPYTAVVVPSQSVDPTELAKIEGVAHYEERSLFNLMLLRHPRQRVVFVTSKRLDPLVVDYFLHQMRGVPSAHARRRLTLLDCDDASPRPLTQKVLERPRLLDRIREAIEDEGRAHMIVFNATHWERTLSVQLGIPLYGCDPDLADFGTKSGARRAFVAAGLRVPPGRGDLRDEGDLVEAAAEVWADEPDARRLVVKLNDSFSGEGNAVLSLPVLEEPTAAARQRAVQAALPALSFVAPELSWESYREQFDGMGGVVEVWLEGERKTSPSVQLRVNPAREVMVVSTHDQVLGGPSGQVFEGATFPAEERVRGELQSAGRRVGQTLAEAGVMGRFGVDFVARDGAGGGLDLFAIEINLRQGGTTHPFNTLKFLTDGRYDEASGQFFTAQGQPRSYFATDVLKAAEYRGLLPFDLLDLLVLRGIQFHADETGIVFHLLGCLSQYGKLGCTAIAHSVADARALYATMVQALDEVCGR